MSNHLNGDISLEIQKAVRHLPPYENGPGVDYKEAQVAYAANITLLHDPTLQTCEQTGQLTLGPQAHALIALRGSGDGGWGMWGGVSGYVDTWRDKNGEIVDPILFTARKELAEECGMCEEDINNVTFRLGRRFEEPWNNGGLLHVLPLLGIFNGAEKPAIQVDGHELLESKWLPLGAIATQKDISLDYVHRTFPYALEGVG